MSYAIPPELLTPEDAAAELQSFERRISREWVVYALVDTVILVPWVALVIAYTMTDAIALTTLALATIVAIGIDGAMTLYWVRRRIRPLQERRTALERIAAAETG